MKKKLQITLLSSLLVVLVVSACASVATPTATVEVPPATAPATEAAAPTTAPAPATEAPAPTEAVSAAKPSEEEMLALLTEKLKGSPHTVEFVLSKEKTAEEWDKTLTTMIKFGAKINDEEKQLLIDWLVSR